MQRCQNGISERTTGVDERCNRGGWRATGRDSARGAKGGLWGLTKRPSEGVGEGGNRWGVSAAWESASRGKMGTKGGESRRPGTSPPGGMHLRGGDWQRQVLRGAGVVPEGLLEPSGANLGTLFANCVWHCRVRRLRSRVSALRCRLVQFPALSRMEFQP